MNKFRRCEIDAVISDINKIKGQVESILNEEEEYRDNIPENLQGSERYENAENACDSLENVIDSLNEAIRSLEEAK